VRLDVLSVGQATPAVARALAINLKLPVEHVAKSIYRAPSTLVADIPEELADKMADLLREAGLDVATQQDSTPALSTSKSLDLSIRLSDPAYLLPVAEQLAVFLGCPLDTSVSILTAPPAMVLGGVSTATADALAIRLADLPASVIASDRHEAVYDLFLVQDEPMLHQRVARALTALGITPLDDPHLMATNLDQATADKLWASLKQQDAIRLLNRDFAHFELILHATAQDADLSALSTLSGMPAQLVGEALKSLPLVIDEDISFNNLPEKLLAYEQAGFTVEAKLTTFLRYELTLNSITSVEAVLAVLGPLKLADIASIGQMKLPYKFPQGLSEPMARAAEAMLLKIGCDAHIEEVGQ